MPEFPATTFPSPGGEDEPWDDEDPERPRTMQEIIDAMHMEGATGAWEMSLSKAFANGFPEKMFQVRTAPLHLCTGPSHVALVGLCSRCCWETRRMQCSKRFFLLNGRTIDWWQVGVMMAKAKIVRQQLCACIIRLQRLSIFAACRVGLCVNLMAH